jgi:uncharacterized Zn finger protein
MDWRGHTPDYSRLKHRLERLVDQGHCDEVVELGRDLIHLGMEQVGQSDDEGDTASALAECLGVVFDVLGKSKLSGPDKILYAIDACLADEYDVIGECVNKILDAKWSAADWSAVANRLTERLSSIPIDKGEDFSSKYERDRICDSLLDALAKAGRDDELLTIYESEARSAGSYDRLVHFLIEEGEYERAEYWAREGIEKTLAKFPGIASGLANLLCEMARRRKQWEIVAAHTASDFFQHPSAERFDELMKSAERAKCRSHVEAAALKFLETGVPPNQASNDKKNGQRTAAHPSWPLPMPEYLLPLRRDRSQEKPRPHLNVLLDMAIAAKQPEEVLRWYDKIVGQKQSSKRSEFRWQVADIDANRVAKAVVATHPERALEIYRRKLDANLQHTGSSAYQVCAECLRHIRSIYKLLDQEDHWGELVADIRFKYRNRPRFMEALDRMEHKKIVQSRKASRR